MIDNGIHKRKVIIQNKTFMHKPVYFNIKYYHCNNFELRIDYIYNSVHSKQIKSLLYSSSKIFKSYANMYKIFDNSLIRILVHTAIYQELILKSIFNIQ